MRRKLCRDKRPPPYCPETAFESIVPEAKTMAGEEDGAPASGGPALSAGAEFIEKQGTPLHEPEEQRIDSAAVFWKGARPERGGEQLPLLAGKFR